MMHLKANTIRQAAQEMGIPDQIGLDRQQIFHITGQ